MVLCGHDRDRAANTGGYTSAVASSQQLLMAYRGTLTIQSSVEYVVTHKSL